MAAAGLFLIYYSCYGQKKDKIMEMGRNLLLISAFIIWTASSAFSWNDLQMCMGKLKFLIQNIQFPWRMLGIGTLILTVFTCVTVRVFKEWDKYGVTAIAVILCLAVISSGYLLNDRMNDNYVWCVKNVSELNTFNHVGGEYMPESGGYPDYSIVMPECSPNIEMLEQERDYHCFNISCRNKSKGEGYIDMPLLYYRGYVAKDMTGGNKLEVVKSETCNVRVIIPADYDGKILLTYQERWYWRVAELISLFCVLGSIIALTYREKGNFLKL